MTFFYNRPTRLYLTGDCQKVSRLMRRRPLHKCGTIKFNDDNIKREKKVDGDDVVTSSTDKKIENESDGKESTSSSSTSSPNDSKESISDTLDNNNKLTDTNTTVAASTTSTSVKMSQHKLDKILKKLADRISTKLALNGNSTNGHHANNNNNNNNNNHTTSNLPPTSYSLASHIANSINTQPHQHVSPRKRILRELEKVSLEDTKRSRPKTNATINGNVTATLNNNNNHNNNNINNNTFSNGSLIKTEKAPTVSRPISSYSITSLLAHNTSTGCNNLNNNNSINSNDSLSTSHFHQQPQQQQRLSLNSPPTPPTAKSPQMMHNKRKSPNTSPPRLNQSIGSPSQSPSPEHHAFHKYRPITTTPTSNPASSSPYNSSYHSPNYMRGSPSPHDRLRTTGNFQHSPSHYGTSSPQQQQQQNYSVGVAHRDSSLSPNVERSSTTSNNNSNNNNNRSTPTSSSSGIRTVPKKTAALRQQFSSPTMESSNKISKSAPTMTAMQNMKNEKPMDVDSLLRPSALIPPSPMSAALGHPAAPLSHYPYMYPPLSYLQPTVPPYYPSFYNPAMMAAAVAYRFPIPGYPPTATSLSPVSNTHTPSQITNPTLASSSNHYDKNSNGHPRSSSISSSPPEATTTHHHSYVPTSPWNPISLTNHHHHSISDGNNLISKVKDEQSSGEYLLVIDEITLVS